jgi:hypothetical protein
VKMCGWRQGKAEPMRRDPKGPEAVKALHVWWLGSTLLLAAGVRLEA